MLGSVSDLGAAGLNCIRWVKSRAWGILAAASAVSDPDGGTANPGPIRKSNIDLRFWKVQSTTLPGKQGFFFPGQQLN